MAAKIHTNKGSAWYGPKKAIEEITLDFEEHAVSEIIGPPGCGKSPLLRCRTRMHEPTPKAKIEDLIFDLKKDYTVVIVTHNMQQAARVAETTAFMYLGHLIEVGPTRELFERPKETLTESYITGRFG